MDLVMIESRKLTLRGKFENIPQMIDFVADAAQSAGLSEDEIFHCQMAVDEACTNIIEHAYGGDNHGDITIICTIKPSECEIELVDRGTPFDPESIPEPVMSGNLDEIEPGGIGLHLMRKMMDDVTFSFEDGQNRLVMTKRHVQHQPREKVPITQEEITDNIWLLEPGIRLDATAAPLLEPAMNVHAQTAGRKLVVDMSQTEYISSRGLKVLVNAWRATAEHDGAVVLCCLRPNVLAVFNVIGFDQLFDIYADRSQALTALGA